METHGSRSDNVGGGNDVLEIRNGGVHASAEKIGGDFFVRQFILIPL